MALIIKDDEGREQEVKDVKIKRALGFSEIYATGVQGGPFGPYDFRISFFDQIIEKDETEKKFYEVREIKQSIIMPYATAKQFSLWLKKHLDDFEQKTGHEIYIGEQK